MQPIELLETPGTHRIKFVGPEGSGMGELPALVYPEGSVLTRWELSDEEREAIARGEAVDLWVWTFAKPLQPLLLRVSGIEYPEDD